MYTKQDIVAKLLELNAMIQDSKLACNISLEACDQDGNEVYNLYVDGGFWRNSTAVCNDNRPEQEDVLAKYDWTPSQDC